MTTTTGCDALYRLLHKEGAQEKKILGELVPYESNEQVAQVQKLLKLFGYKIGRVDGVLGPNTRNAIAAFQEDNNLKVSRFVDQATWQQMHVFDAYGLVVDGELNISAVQQALQNAGFDPGPIDGKMGRRTQVAIEAFQSAMELKPDGRIGVRTLNHLAAYLSFEE